MLNRGQFLRRAAAAGIGLSSAGRALDAAAAYTVPGPRVHAYVTRPDLRPPIVSVLMRSATIRGRADMLQARQNADLLIAPELEGIEIRNWKAYDPAVDAGYVAAVQALDSLDAPLTQLRAKRRRQAEIAEQELIDAR